MEAEAVYPKHMEKLEEVRGPFVRTIVSAMNPKRLVDSYTEIFLEVWFEEFNGPVPFMATPFDCERHGKELWIRAMGGEYGPIEIVPSKFEAVVIEPVRMLTYDDTSRS